MALYLSNALIHVPAMYQPQPTSQRYQEPDLCEVQRGFFREGFIGQAERHVLKVPQHRSRSLEAFPLLRQVGDDWVVGICGHL